MRVPKGFKGEYFKLTAIEALSGEVKLNALKSSFISRATVYFALVEEEDDDPPEESFICPCSKNLGNINSKPCHCNSLFKRRASLLFFLSKFFRLRVCRCRKTKTGLAPPPLF